MTLQILINHYKEDEKKVKTFLKSLNMQNNIKFEALIISDGGDIHLTQEQLKGYSFPIKYAYCSHTGVCNTRNILLNESNADYIMFCDIDDMFWKPNGLFSLMQVAEQTKADIIGSPYNCEYYNTNNQKMEYKTLEKDTLRVHGKIFKRQYLIDNNITFPSSMEVSGDMAFLWLAYSLTNKIIWIKNNFYIWKWNPNSVTRSKEFFTVNTFDITLKCYMVLAEELKRRKLLKVYNDLLGSLFAMIYVQITHPYWKTAPKEMQLKGEEAAIICLNKYYNDYVNIEEKNRKKRYRYTLDYIYGKDYSKDNFENMLPWIRSKIKQETDILIIGYGNMGQNLEKELKKLQPDIYDKYKNINTKQNKKYKIAFICVPTPYTDEIPCDVSEVYSAIMENDAEIYIIKSTVLPGITNKLCKKTKKNIIFSPKYYNLNQNYSNFNLTILGGDKENCKIAIQTLQKIYDEYHQFYITDASTAELVKYMENSYFITKMSFCKQFYNLAKQLNINYEELQKLFILDPRIDPSYTSIYYDNLYQNNIKSNKDIIAISKVFNASLLKDIIKFNEQQEDK